MTCAEYLRRNAVMAKACGLKAEIEVTARRLQQLKRIPKWLLASIEAMNSRAHYIPPEIAAWRDSSPDNPYS